MADMAKLAKLAEIYIAARDRKAELKREYEAKARELDEVMSGAERMMLVENPVNSGVKSLNTEAGTIRYSIERHANVTDWPAFYEFVASKSRFDMLHRRVSDKTVVEFIEDPATNPDALPPPGVLITSARKISVTKR
jgi:hypothetical protein